MQNQNTTTRAFPLTTEKGVRSSILVDSHIYRWFFYTIYQKSINESFQEDKEFLSCYQKLQRFNFYLIFATIAIGIVFLQISFSINLLSFLGLLLSGLIFFLLFQQRRSYVSSLGWMILNKNFSSQELSGCTLYQLSEKLSERYNLVSLVDAMYHLERQYKAAFLFCFLLFGYILYVNTWIYRFIAFIVFYFLVVWVVNLPFFYGRLKKA